MEGGFFEAVCATSKAQGQKNDLLTCFGSTVVTTALKNSSNSARKAVNQRRMIEYRRETIRCNQATQLLNKSTKDGRRKGGRMEVDVDEGRGGRYCILIFYFFSVFGLGLVGERRKELLWVVDLG